MIDLSQYAGKKIAVFGLGKAGRSTIAVLQNSGAMLYIWDDHAAGREAIASELGANDTLAAPETYPWNEIEFLVLAPGVPLTHPKPHRVVELAQAEKCPIICDLELLYRAQPHAIFVGITGTNGKSTTTSLIHHMLIEAGVKAEVGGNLGYPALSLKPLQSDGVYVLEMSSYQLDLLEKLHFNISLLLNITPDHLDRHGGMDGYIAAKSHIFDRQGKGDTAIIGMDDDYSRTVYDTLTRKAQIETLIPVSCQHVVAGGVSAKNGKLMNGMKATQEVWSYGDVPSLPGRHNAQNIAAAYAVCRRLGVETDVLIKAIQSFGGLAHRIQLVAKKGGVSFVNDSKATNAEAASKALASYDHIHWIIGGVPKEGGIESLEEYFPRVRHAYLIGQAEQEFAGTLEGKVPYSRCGDLHTALTKASQDALSAGKGVVLLSPACASFDQWKNFEARGDAFCKMVEEL